MSTMSIPPQKPVIPRCAEHACLTPPCMSELSQASSSNDSGSYFILIERKCPSQRPERMNGGRAGHTRVQALQTLQRTHKTKRVCGPREGQQRLQKQQQRVLLRWEN